MGLFSSSKTPKEPLPDLELHLSSPQDAVFKPNDTISGHVALSTPRPLNPQAVEVTFWGQSKTWIRTSSSSTVGNNNSTNYYHYRDEAPLFHVTYNLLEKSDTLFPGQTYNYQFSFRVPEGTSFNRSKCSEDPAENIWETGPHPLPPSFNYGDDDPSDPIPPIATITYGVTTRLICPGVYIGKPPETEPLSATAPIFFIPHNPQRALYPPYMTRFSKKFTLASSALTGQHASSVSFRQRLSDHFSSSTPRVDFELGLEIPDKLLSGQEFGFRGTFNVLHKTNTVVSIPAMTFKILKLEILQYTLFRAGRDWKASNTISGYPSSYRDSNHRGTYRASEEMEVTEDKTHLNSLPESKILQLEEIKSEKGVEEAKSLEVWFKGRIPGQKPPSFRSFAITHSYRVKIKCMVEIAGKGFEMIAEAPEVSLYS